MANLHAMPMTAAENIPPSVVVKTNNAGIDFGVKKCGNNASTDIPFGIAQNWTEGAPGTPFDTGYAASTGKRIMVWAAGATAVAAVQLQGGNLPAGSLVGPNAASEIVPVTSGWAVGYLLEAGSLTQRWRLRVYVHPVRLTTGSTS